MGTSRTSSAEGFPVDAQVLSAGLSHGENNTEEEPPGKCKAVRAETDKKEADPGTCKEQKRVRKAPAEVGFWARNHACSFIIFVDASW